MAIDIYYPYNSSMDKKKRKDYKERMERFWNAEVKIVSNLSHHK